MHIHCILADKGTNVATIDPGATSSEAARALAEHNVGALLVTDEMERILGIVSERDLARAIADSGDISLVTVGQIMTSEVVTCHPDDTIDSIMGTMTNHRIRHLPVVDTEGSLCGIVSIGDVVKHRFDELAAEAAALQEYIAAGR